MKQRKELFASFIEESKKAALKLNIKKKKKKIMASGPITSWQRYEEKVEALTDLIFLGSKITQQMVTAATKLKDACSLEGNL